MPAQSHHRDGRHGCSQRWRIVRLSGLPLATAVLIPVTALTGCVKEPQPRATVLRELDSGCTSSSGGGMGYLGDQGSVGITTRAQ